MGYIYKITNKINGILILGKYVMENDSLLVGLNGNF